MDTRRRPDSGKQIGMGATKREPPAGSFIPGRGAAINPPNRFESLHVVPDPDCPPEERPHPRTQFMIDASESLLTRNESPDVPFAYGLNAYRGCEHGCATASPARTKSISGFPAASISRRRSW